MTSLVWPALLAPFWKIGFRGLSIVWVAWALGTLAHAGVAVEAALLCRRLTSRTFGLLTLGMCLAFGPFAWFAWSGMETMALSWVLLRGTRKAAIALDQHSPSRTPSKDPSEKALFELAVLGFFGPLVRPEGAFVSLVAALAIVFRGKRWTRLLALVALGGCGVMPALCFALTGHATPATARVKWLAENPYFDAHRLFWQFGKHAEVLFFDVLDGGEWTWLFVPKGFVLWVMFGAIALVLCARRARWTAALTFALFASVVLTCSYQTFLWNRLRYVWPFVPAGIVMGTCFLFELGLILRRIRPWMQTVAPALGGAIIAQFAALLPLTLADVSRSAKAVDAQQVAISEWAKTELPPQALVGVNDTGAIAYIGERRTFDIVGLTTDSEGPAWVAGAGSRLEHYERMNAAQLPTHFIIYPEWFGCDMLLGRELTRRTVTDHAILGGDVMVAYEASFEGLRSGQLPLAPLEEGTLIDEVDVSDLGSEAAHDFELFGAWDAENIVGSSDLENGAERFDGGRRARHRDAFFVETAGPDQPTSEDRLGSSGRAHGRGALSFVMRVSAEEAMTLRVRMGGDDAATIRLDKSTWIESEFLFSPKTSSDPSAPSRIRVEVIALDEHGREVSPRSRKGPTFASFHYWVFERKKTPTP